MPRTVDEDRSQISPRKFADADWFGLAANPEGTINVPLVDRTRKSRTRNA